MASDISKIERVSAPHSPGLWVDLCLSKSRGVFFAIVGGERIEAPTKEEAVARTKAALAKLTNVGWRQVIVLRVTKRNQERTSQENGLDVLRVDCSFTYMRRERAANPLAPKQQIERDHPLDFEERVAEWRERESYFGASKAEKKRRADTKEAEMRQQRLTLAHVRERWARDEDDVKEYELPYTEEAWAGIERIAVALHATQENLDELAASATPSKLAKLVDEPLLLMGRK